MLRWLTPASGTAGGKTERLCRPTCTVAWCFLLGLQQVPGTSEEPPKLHVSFEPMVERIRFLAGHVLSSMMVLSDFLLRRIAPLQSRARPAWQYTGEGDATRLEHGQGSNLAPDVQRALLGKLSPDPSSAGFTTLPLSCTPLCSD
jgi:hypothetical protein